MKNSVITTLNFEIKDGKAVVKFVDMRLDLDRKLDDKMYYYKNGIPNPSGFKVIQTTLIQGLISSIQTQHQLKQVDSAENLRFVISELERAFVHIMDATFIDQEKELPESKNEIKACPNCNSTHVMKVSEEQSNCLNCGANFS